MRTSVLKKTVKYTKTIDGWLSLSEGLLLYILSSKVTKNSTIVEIGSWKGKSTVFLGLGAKKTDSRVYAIDPFKGRWVANQKKIKSTYTEFKKNIAFEAIHQYVIPIKETSVQAGKKWKKPIDFLFIDGLHDFKNVSYDFTTWTQFLREGGIVALHDAFCGQPGPMKVATEYILNNNSFGVPYVVGSIVYAEKRINMNSLQKVRKSLKGFIIHIAFALYNSSKLPSLVKIIIIHKFLKIFLLGRHGFNTLGIKYALKT